MALFLILLSASVATTPRVLDLNGVARPATCDAALQPVQPASGGVGTAKTIGRSVVLRRLDHLEAGTSQKMVRN